jgi:hypothetical protein
VGSPAAADETARLTGDDAAHAAAQAGDVAAAGTIVALPDLGIAHRLPGGGMNLWRMPLSDLEAGYGQPQLVKTLNFGGFSYDNSRTLAGDFGDITPSDDGTADHVIWHAQSNGGVLLWGVGGGSDTTPRLWQDLRTGGWSYADSQPMVADVNGDGWDDLVVRHRLVGTWSDNIWVFLSDGQRLGPPQLWEGDGHYSSMREVYSDFTGDGRDDRLTVMPVVTQTGYALDYSVNPTYWDGQGGGIQSSAFSGPASAGWSFAASRQLAGDVTGDGRIDVITVHAQAGGGLLVWMHRGCGDGWSPCLEAPVIWQDLRTGGWSFAGSRQYLADTNGDGRDDLVTLHSQSGNPGILVWRHLSTGSGLADPQIVADLRTGGWSYGASREGVADTYGLL